MTRQSYIYRVLQHILVSYSGVSFMVIALLLSCNQIQQLSPAPSEAFFKVFGGGYSQQASDILQTEDGGFLLFGSSNSFDDGKNWDMFLLKTDPDGNELWSKYFDFGANDDFGNVIIPAYDQGYILCGTSIDGTKNKVRLLKVDMNGEMLWSNSEEWIGTGEDIVRTADRGYMLTGSTAQIDPLKADGFSPLVKDSTDILAIKINEDGQEVWRKVYGYKGVDKGVAIEALENDRYAILGTTDFPENGVLDLDVLLILINQDGNPYATQIYGSNAPDEARDLALGPEGNLISLESRGARLNIQEIPAQLTFDLPGNISGNETGAITPLEGGGYVVIGTERAGNQRGKDIILRESNEFGEEVWLESFGSTGNDIGAKCIPLAQGGFAFVGTIGFGANTMIGLFKINQNGELLPQ